MKKVCFLLLFCCFFLVGCNEKKETPEEEFIYSICNDEVTIEGLKQDSIEIEVFIPKMISGKKVTKINDYAFKNRAISKMVISDTVTSIGIGAFANCYVLSELSIGSNVKEIGNFALSDNFSLKTISVSKKNETFSSYKGALYSKDLLTLVKFPENPNLPVQFASSVEKIGDYAFQSTKLVSLTLPKKIKMIGNFAFLRASQLTSLTFTSDLEEVGNYAFKDSNIKRLTFPKSLKKIGVGGICNPSILKIVFEGEAPQTGSLVSFKSSAIIVKDLAYQTFIQNTTFYPISKWIFKESEVENDWVIRGDTLVRYFGEDDDLTLPTQVKKIGEYAFMGTEALKSVDLRNITELDTGAFMNSGLVQVVLESCLRIGEYGFALSTNLEKIYISSKVNFIGKYCFVLDANVKVFMEDAMEKETFEEKWNESVKEITYSVKKEEF